MRSYHQYCAVARALDVVGDRWSLLIVRELLLRGPCRYTDLQDGLPGIATNLLTDRLRDLEDADVIDRAAAPPPIATTLYQLSERGQALAPVIHALTDWGAQLMVEIAADDVFRSHWLSLPTEHFLIDRDPDAAPITIEVHTGDQPMLIETVDGAVRARPGADDHADAIIIGTPEVVIALFAGMISLREARARGLHFRGATSALRRVQAQPRK